MGEKAQEYPDPDLTNYRKSNLQDVYGYSVGKNGCQGFIKGYRLVQC